MEKGEIILKKIESINNLPTLPVVIDKLKEAIRNPNADARQIASIIEDDPSMMARILKVVNSALYRGREEVTSLQMAVARMGFNAISNIAMSTSLFSVFKDSKGGAFNPEEFWRHCISTGIAADVLYERCRSHLKKRYTSDVLQLAGLLHDVGKIVLEQFFHIDFRKSIAAAEERAMELPKIEREVLGVSHAEVGAVLGMRWHLGRDFLQVIRWHHEPRSVSISPECSELVMLCHTANYICNLERIGNGGDLPAPSFDQKVWSALGLTVSDISDIVDTIKEESKKSEILMSFI